MELGGGQGETMEISKAVWEVVRVGKVGKSKVAKVAGCMGRKIDDTIEQ
jgi:hypothetical protein